MAEPGEFGSGVNVVLQRDGAFLTFFVYDATGNPVWSMSNAQLWTNRVRKLPLTVVQ